MRTVDAAGLPIGEAHPPRIMGVVTVDPTSRDDATGFAESDAAAAHIDDLVDAGADIVNVRFPAADEGVEPPAARESLDRLDLAANAVASSSRSTLASIETPHHGVVGAALDRGFAMVYDVSGFADSRVPRVCADHGVAVVKRAAPAETTTESTVDSIDEVHEIIQRGGFTDRTIIEPILGGSTDSQTAAVDRETVRRLPEFRGYGRPILVSPDGERSPRSLVGRSTGDALAVSLGATALAVDRGASVVRTRHVGPTRDAAIAGSELGRDRVHHGGEISVIELDIHPAGALRRQLTQFDVDGARAGDWSYHVFGLFGLTEHRAWVRERLESRGIVTHGSDPLLIAGSARSIRRLYGISSELPDPVEAAIEAVIEGVR